MFAVSEIADVYLRPSNYTRTAQRDELVLQTAAGLTPQGLIANPVFFRGHIQRPDVAAAGLLTLLNVASTRYFNPIPGGFASLDPAVTAHGDRLRCEAFSACNGVYVRLDLNAQVFDSGTLGFGTTNIDLHAPLARALAGIQASDKLFLSVGPDEIAVTTNGEKHIERKVHLPERWVRALAETQSIAAGMALRASLDNMAWRRFIHALPTSGGSGAGVKMWLIPSATGIRQTGRPLSGAISLAGSAKLSSMKRLQHLVQSVNIYGPEVRTDTKAAVSVWEFLLPGGRITLMLSPEPYRGFSGEGAMLQALGISNTTDAHILDPLLAWEPVIDLRGLVEETQLTEDRLKGALQVLATSGHVGYDLHENAYFHRQLPFVEARVEANYLRLAAARELLASGAVCRQGEYLRVTVEGRNRWVNFSGAVPRCTCYFWMKHQGTRGPCKHILAAQLFEPE